MMKRNKKRFLKVSLCSLMLSMGMNVQASGIPTIDGAVLGQGVQSFMEYLQQYTEQLNTWDIEEQNFTKHFKSVTTGLNIADKVFNNDMQGALKEMGFQRFYEEQFSKAGGNYITALASMGISGLTDGTQGIISQMYPKDGDKATAEGRAKNSVHELCGIYDGIALDLTLLDKAKLQADSAAANKMMDTIKNIEGQSTEDGKESASMVGSVQAALDLQSKEYAKNEQSYATRRSEMVDQMEIYRQRCEQAQSDFSNLAAAAIGVGAKLQSLKFGSGSNSKQSFDPRFN